jgi:hypothetical protein
MDGSVRSSPQQTSFDQQLIETNGPSLPRVSVRTLMPLAQHLNRILDLLTEEVIAMSLQALPRRRSTTDPGR